MEKEEEKKDDDCTPGQTGTLQREWLERSHRRKNQSHENMKPSAALGG
jgi:hypothetical protein